MEKTAENNIDNKLIPVASRYSEALLQVAREKNIMDNVSEDLATVSDSLNCVREMKDFLCHPVIPQAEKKDMINSVFSGRISGDVLNLLLILAEKNKVNWVDAIRYCYDSSLDEARNILKVGVVSAVEIDQDLKDKLRDRLENKLHKSIKFAFDIRPSILAGLILKIKDKTIDGSLASKLQWFKKFLR